MAESKEDRKIRKQLKKYDAEVARGIVHTHNYDIKMQQYRLVLEGRYPQG